MESKNIINKKKLVIFLAKESEITTIRIPKTVKDKLDKVALEKESYHVTIQRLIRENNHLKKENDRYSLIIKGMFDKLDEVENITWEDVKKEYNGD